MRSRLAVAIVGSSLFTSLIAYAQQPPESVPATPLVRPDGTGAEVSPELQPKVEKAKEQAKSAELTAIVPSPGDVTRPAFQLYAEIDLPILAVGVVFGTARLFKTSKAFCAPLCDSSELNALDGLTAGWWSPEWSTASDIGFYAIATGAATLLLVDEGVWPALNDAVVVAESALSATALVSMMTLAAGRPRPFLYGTSAPEATRNGADAGLSYLSSHATVTAAIAMSTFMAARRLHPHSWFPTVVLAVGVATTVFVGVARVEAGQHFITDAIGGGIVGAGLGVLIPALHGSPVKVVPIVTSEQKGFAVSGRF